MMVVIAVAVKILVVASRMFLHSHLILLFTLFIIIILFAFVGITGAVLLISSLIHPVYPKARIVLSKKSHY